MSELRVQDADTEGEQPTRPGRARRRATKWLRRIGVCVLAVVVVATAVCLIFNRATRPPVRIEPGFGAYVKVGASEVHYETWGKGGTPIVLVPGFLESSTVWSTVGPLLGKDHVVYALDLPGHGYTRYSGPMLLRDQAELVHGFVRTLRLDRPALVGHSLGAAVVGEVALRHPQDVRKVIFADGDGLKMNLGPKWLRSVVLNSPYMTTVMRIGSRWTAADKWFIKRICGASCQTPSTALTKQWVRPLHQRSGEDALRDLMINADYGLAPEQVSAISVPSAIIWGSDDGNGGSLDKTIVNLHRPPTRIIRNAGHLTMLAAPEAFAQAVESLA
ncbi:alpha/beta hydrolase [Actinomadura sp. NPDC049382]|uniref:alpha/beta fold hydrolase n=1 Tax=Actinomadura sp. NPDC049382 TaxID=3158220 RepID=UPI00342C4055